MEHSPRDPKKPKKRAGFSLIVVLIISLVGLAILGATLQFTVSAGGAGRVAGASGAKYNLLQEAVEEGKAALMEIMDNTKPIPRHANADEDDEPPIDDLSDLLVSADLGGPARGVVKNQPISSSELGRLGIMDNTGGGGTLSVHIYDMQYTPTLIDDSSMPADEFEMLPPSIILDFVNWSAYPNLKQANEEITGPKGAANTGAYLIRATLSVGGRKTTLDTAVLQANNM
jgi:hypothetical protein